MGSLPYRERRALQLHRQINEDRYHDPFDADYDQGEVPLAVVPRDDLSFRPAVVPETTKIDVESARQQLARVLAVCRRPAARPHAQNAFKSFSSWHDTPELYRRMVAHAAGLGRDVVDKVDRDLTEQEKAMLRIAAADMRTVLSSLVAL